MPLFNKGPKPHFLIVTHYAGGRRERLLFLQVLIMAMSICRTECPEEWPLQGTNSSWGLLVCLLDAPLQPRQLNLVLKHCTSTARAVTSSLFPAFLVPVEVCWGKTWGISMMKELRWLVWLLGNTREKRWGQHLEPISDFTEDKSSISLNPQPGSLNVNELLSDVSYSINIPSGCDFCFIRPAVY